MLCGVCWVACVLCEVCCDPREKSWQLERCLHVRDGGGCNWVCLFEMFSERVCQ